MQRERYLRQARVQGLDPEVLQAMHVAVVGAGAVGNEVVKNLALMGVGSIDVHDFDHVEIHNLTRSVFLREADIGAPKGAAVAARAAEIDPNVRIAAIEGDAWRTLTLARLRSCSALVACVDNIEARMRLSQLALLAGVPFVNCGIDARHVSVESMPFDAPLLPACYECLLPASAYERVAEHYSCGWLRRALLAERVVPTTAVTASLAGALAVQAVVQRDAHAQQHSRRVFLDSASGHATVSSLRRHDGCVACGGFVRRPRVMSARGAHWRDALREHAPAAHALRLSDGLIFDIECRHCGARDDAARCVGQRADDFDDTLMRCAQCGEVAVQVEIHAETTVEALESRFGSRHLPLKFLLVEAGDDDDTMLCIDLEDPA